MSTKYPAQIDTSITLSKAIDNLTPVQGKVFNDLRDAVIAIESALGVAPSGTFGTVKARLDALSNMSGGGVQLGLDLGGTADLPKVIGIQGRSVSANAPSDGWVLTWNDSLSQWEPAASLTTAGGDLSGNYPDPIVAQIQGNAVKNETLGASQNGYVLTWVNVNSQWEAIATAATFIAAGDLTGNSTNQTVIAINGASVPASGSLTAGNILQVTGVAALSYAPLNLSGGSNYITGTLPQTNSYAFTFSDVLGNGLITGGNNPTISVGDSIISPAGTGATAGGNIPLTAGDGGSTGNGGSIVLTAGNGGATSGDGGNITLAPGINSGTGSTGIIQITGLGSEIIFDQVSAVPVLPGASNGSLWVKDTVPTTLIFTDSTGNDTTLGVTATVPTLAQVLMVGNVTDGYSIILSSGDSIHGQDTVGGDGGSAVIRGGAGDSANNGGSVDIVGGDAGPTGGNPGNINITGGSATNGNGASVIITATDGAGTSKDGGNIVLTPGNNTSGGAIGTVQITGTGSEIRFDQVSSVPVVPGANKGALWVKNTSPTTLIFTDSSGADTTLGASAVSPNLSTVLTTGNTTGGTDIILTSGDALRGEAGSGTTGGIAAIVGGIGGTTNAGGAVNITGGAGGATSGDAGAVNIIGGTPINGNGGNISITGSDGVSGTNSGGNITLLAGNSVSSGTAGVISITAGTGGSSSAGGTVIINGGDGGSSSGAGGSVTVRGGTSTDGNGGAVNLTGRDAVGTNRNGGLTTILAGNATGSGIGGNSTVTAGSGGATGTAGNITLTGGAGGSTSGTAGGINIIGGTPVDGDGGLIAITASSAATTTAASRDGGALTITSGSPVSGGTGGLLSLVGGNASSNGTGASISITAGSGGTTGTAGSISITGGAGGGTSGDAGGITISGGTPISGHGASINLVASAGAGTSKNGGNIVITPGDHTSGGIIGVVQITGSGSEIRFDEVSTVPVTPGANKGALWVKNTSPTTLIFTDSSGADTTLGSGGSGTFTITTVSTGTTLSGNNQIINITVGGININLPPSPSASDYFYFKDSNGSAYSSNITISGNGNNIDDQSTFVMDTGYMAVFMVYNGTIWMIL